MGNRSAYIRSRSGFTLVETLVAITLLIAILSIAYSFLGTLIHRANENSLKAQSLAEVTSLNAMISNIVRNSYGIVYEDTQTSSSTDTLVLWSDKLERSKIKIFVQPDTDRDISRVFVQYNNGTPQPLNSSNLFIKTLNVETSPNPKSNPSVLEDQPWVSAEIIGRTRSILERPTDDSFFRDYEKSDSALYGRWVLRNYVPSSLKM